MLAGPPPAHLSRSSSKGEDAVSWGKGVKEVMVVGGETSREVVQGEAHVKNLVVFFLFFKFIIKESPSWGGAGC